ncbi:TFIID-18kDa-domain-containing protein [Macrolepiota fuliginosa MF-IS2]|uniref:Transcription initiation factor TFIID subunit 13 n=1 Tax=Macrolepiota fuliginosa MF-IS2 TaxID=1400762 RepID=A0A9P5XPG5_9AGAR|nr:TFIID-18kDa-domain-containing protein [Macrolepiota fuliginosa MF-IS2]
MSYTPYTPTAGAHPPTSTTYPYGAYHPTTYAQTPGAYSYQAPAYQTGVTSYGWPYTYSYIQHPQAVAQRPTSLTTPAPITAQNATSPAATTPVPPPVPQRSAATFTTYTPSYMRDNTTNAMAGSFSTRGSRKQSNLKGLFMKELKSLMYGFGDDRNPSNDTVNVMEEILIEYITDVCQQAGGPNKKSRLSIDDLRRVLSRPADAKKLARMEELLFMQEDIKRARAQFEESDIHNPKEF